MLHATTNLHISLGIASFANDILATFPIQLLDSICMMARACVNHIQTLPEEDITKMLQEPVIMALASIVFDPSAFKVLQGKNINESNSFLSSKKTESLQRFLSFHISHYSTIPSKSLSRIKTGSAGF